LPVIAPRPARLRTWGLWTAVVLASGGFWFARNLLRAGNPLPWYRVHLGPLDLPSPPLPQTNANSYSLVHYIGNLHLWRREFVPGLDDSLGHLWPAVVVLAAAGAALALLAGRDPLLRMLGATGAGALVAYPLTPASAGGPEGVPILFGLNLRFATPALALG